MARRGALTRLAKKKAQIIEGVLADKLAGITTEQIAAKWGISRSAVLNYWSRFRKSGGVQGAVQNGTKERPDNVSPQVKLNPIIANYRNRLKEKAIIAIESGLDCPADPYKQAAIGVQTMRGLGEFSEHVASSSVSLLIANIPAELVDEFQDCVIDVDPEPVPLSDGSNVVAQLPAECDKGNNANGIEAEDVSSLETKDKV